MENVVDGYVTYLQLEKNISENTIEAYRLDLKKLVTFLENISIFSFDKVSFTHLNSYILQMEKKGRASSTVSRSISTIKSFFGWLYDRRLIKADPSRNLKPPKVEKKVPEILTLQEVDEFLSLPDMESKKGIRDKAMLELLYATGMKVSEIVMLKLSDVDLFTATATIQDKDRERMVRFGNPAKRALDIYINTVRPGIASGDSKELFVNMNGKAMSRQGFWKVIKQYGDSTNFAQKITPHVFRNSFAAHMIENGADLKTLQEILGHAEIATTQVYSAFIPKSKDIYHMHPRK